MIGAENEIDIKLGTETLDFIQYLPNTYVSTQGNFEKIRKVVANLFDFQHRFARPMPLPFAHGQDMEKVLDVPVPLHLLKKYKVAFQIPGDKAQKLSFDDGFTESDITYCFLGGKTCTELVESGAFVGDDYKAIEVTSFSWIQDLFEIFEIATTFDSDRKNVARGLVSCWYNVCCQLDFSLPNEEDDAPFDPTSLIETLSSGVALKMSDVFENIDLMDDDSSGDADFDPDMHEEDEDDDDDDEDDEDDDDEEAEDPNEENAEEEGEEGKGEEEGGDMDEDDELPPLLGQDDEIITELDDFELSPEALNLQEVVFRVVEKLQAFMPDPETAMPWFKRCLKHVRTAQQAQDMAWYPWGCPPMEQLIAALKGEDQHAKAISASIILLFQSQLQQANGNHQEEDFDEYDDEDDEEDDEDDEDVIVEENTTSTTTTTSTNM
jgi:hypothetical protein